MLFWAFRIASALAKAAPLRLAYAVAEAWGALAFVVWRGGRTRCVANMRHVLHEEARAHAAARRSFVNYAIYLVDFLRFTAITRAEVHRRVVFDSWAMLDAARAERGIVFVTMHFGNWDLGAAALAEHGVPVSVVADTFGDPRLNDLVLGSRRALGMEILPAERMGPSILHALKRRAVVAMLIDVPPEDGGVQVEFFGDTITVHDGPARIALRAGASVIAATLPREAPRSDRVRPVLAPVPFTPSGDTERDVHDLTQATMRSLEAMIATHPDQWYIFRALWVADRLATAAPAG